MLCGVMQTSNHGKCAGGRVAGCLIITQLIKRPRDKKGRCIFNAPPVLFLRYHVSVGASHYSPTTRISSEGIVRPSVYFGWQYNGSHRQHFVY